MPQGEYEPAQEYRFTERFRRALGAVTRGVSALFAPPDLKEREQRARAAVEKIWNKHGRDGFIVVPSAEGTMSTPDSVRGLRPADCPREAND